MLNRNCLRGLLLAGLLLPLASCTNSPSLTSITVSPSTMDFTGSGLTTQLTATGYYTHPNHPAETKDITNQVTWASSTPDCVTVSSTGLITSGSNTCTNILVTASSPGFNGVISGSMTVNVTQSSPGGGSTTADVTTITIIPSSQSVTSPGQTGQFIAIGTTSTNATINLTKAVTWSSSSVQVATISSTGLATGVGKGTTTITALYTNATDGTTATGQATFTVTSGTTEPITALTISPGTQALSATGQTGQFIAIGTSGLTGLQEDVTNSSQLKWTSSIPSIATVSTYPTSPAGLATGVSAGTTNITAQWTNPDASVVTATAVVTASVTAQSEPLLSITVVPTSIIMKNLQLTGQFLAFGTFSTDPTLVDITNGFTHAGFGNCTTTTYAAGTCTTVPVTWTSSEPDIFPINETGTPGAPAGVATSLGTGTTAITVAATNADGTVVNGAATFGCTPPSGDFCTAASTELSTLTVMNAGQNQTTWLVTAPSATGTANVIHCGGSTEQAGTGGSVCYANYPTGTTVTLTVLAGHGNFGGWSSNCTPVGNVSETGLNQCQVTLTTSDIVAAIIN